VFIGATAQNPSKVSRLSMTSLSGYLVKSYAAATGRGLQMISSEFEHFSTE
jgi:hypothetical protein